MKVTIDVPDALWQRMRACRGEDWEAVARQAFATRAAQGAAHSAQLRGSTSYRQGYAWARDHADFADLKAVAEAPTYASAADLVRRSRGFNQRDEFGDALQPSDEMWEAFVDGATAQFNGRE
jgi:hypothetical protein